MNTVTFKKAGKDYKSTCGRFVLVNPSKWDSDDNSWYLYVDGNEGVADHHSKTKRECVEVAAKW
jgi:hypothetical protein